MLRGVTVHMDMQGMFRNYYMLRMMQQKTDCVLEDILKFTFSGRNANIPSFEDLGTCIEKDQVAVMHFSASLYEIEMDFDVTPCPYVLKEHERHADNVAHIVDAVYIVGNKYVVLPIRVLYGFISLVGNYYELEYQHINVYVNGHFVNKKQVDDCTDELPKFMNLLYRHSSK